MTTNRSSAFSSLQWCSICTVLFAVAMSGIIYAPFKQSDALSIACPQDALGCPDGSFVGRDPSNNCQFYPCPGEYGGYGDTYAGYAGDIGNYGYNDSYYDEEYQRYLDDYNRYLSDYDQYVQDYYDYYNNQQQYDDYGDYGNYGYYNDIGNYGSYNDGTCPPCANPGPGCRRVSTGNDQGLCGCGGEIICDGPDYGGYGDYGEYGYYNDFGDYGDYGYYNSYGDYGSYGDDGCTTGCTNTDISIRKSGPSQAYAGDYITYTLTVSNVGGGQNFGEATGVVITDFVPWGLEFDPDQSDPSCWDYDKQEAGDHAYEVVCFDFNPDGVITPGQTLDFDLTFYVNDEVYCDDYLVNQADAWGNEGDLNHQNNTSNPVQTLVNCDDAGYSDLSIVKYAPEFVWPGELLTYNLEIENNGTDVAGNVFVADLIPDWLRFVPEQSDETCYQVDTEIWCGDDGDHPNQGFSIPPQWVTDLDLTFEVDPNIPCGSVIENQAEVTDLSDLSGNPIYIQSNWIDTYVDCADDIDDDGYIPPQKGGCIEIIKEAVDPTGNPLYPVPAFTFEIVPFATTFTNQTGVSGPVNNTQGFGGGSIRVTSDRDGVAFVYDLPPGNYNVREIPVNDWDLVSTSPPDGTVSVRQSPTCARVAFRNKAIGRFSGKLGISKTDNRTSAKEGDRLTYVITIVNDSDVNVTDLNVIDTLPPEVDFGTASDGGRLEGFEVRWSGINIPARGSKFLTVEVRVDRDIDQCDFDMINTVFIEGGPSGIDSTRILCAPEEDDDEEPIDDEDDDDQEQIFVSCRKRSDLSQAEAGDMVEFTITVFNDSREDARDLRVRDTISGRDITIRNDGGGDRTSTGLEWDNVRIDANDSRTFTYSIRIGDNVRPGDVIQNTATVSGRNVARSASCESAVRITGAPDDDDDGIVPSPRLFCFKRADRFETQPNTFVNYTVSVQNTGNVPISNITARDTFTAGTLTIEDTGGGTPAGNGLQWSGFSLQPGESRILNYRIRVAPTMTQGQVVSNRVQVSAPQISTVSCNAQLTIIQNLPRTGSFFNDAGDAFLKAFRSSSNNTDEDEEVLRPAAPASTATKVAKVIAWIVGGVLIIVIIRKITNRKPKQAKKKAVPRKKKS